MQSLTLQRESHIRQEAIIRDKQWQAQIAVKSGDQTSRLHTNSDNTDVVGLDETAGGEIHTASDEVYQTIEETDSLLQFLMNRAEAAGRIVTPPEAAMLMARGKPMYENGVKTPKNDRMIIEELRVHIDALRAHIQDLLHESEDQQRDMDHYKRELDHYRKENQELKDRMRHIEKRGALLDDSVDLERETVYAFQPPATLDDLNAIRLPPLEMPKFDFDLNGSNTGSSP